MVVFLFGKLFSKSKQSIAIAGTNILFALVILVNPKRKNCKTFVFKVSYLPMKTSGKSSMLTSFFVEYFDEISLNI